MGQGKFNTKNDNNSFAPYKHNEDVEMVLENAYLRYIEERMNKGLETRMWETNLEEFQKLVDLYLETKKSLDKR